MKRRAGILNLKKHRLHDRVLELEALIAREKNPNVVGQIQAELETTIEKLRHLEMAEVFSPVSNHDMIGMANSRRNIKIAETNLFEDMAGATGAALGGAAGGVAGELVGPAGAVAGGLAAGVVGKRLGIKAAKELEALIKEYKKVGVKGLEQEAKSKLESLMKSLKSKDPKAHEDIMKEHFNNDSKPAESAAPTGGSGSTKDEVISLLNTAVDKLKQPELVNASYLNRIIKRAR
jgi:uncharacterized protein YcfJ